MPCFNDSEYVYLDNMDKEDNNKTSIIHDELIIFSLILVTSKLLYFCWKIQLLNSKTF